MSTLGTPVSSLTERFACPLGVAAEIIVQTVIWWTSTKSYYLEVSAKGMI